MTDGRTWLDKTLAPTGRYEKERLINVGAHRWAAEPELGFLIPLTSKWWLELEAGAWIFGDDHDFLPGKREQTLIFSAEVHLVRRFLPGFWASLEANFFTGGRQTIGEIRLVDVQRNSRVGGDPRRTVSRSPRRQSRVQPRRRHRVRHRLTPIAGKLPGGLQVAKDRGGEQ